jgi:hypothetical protein
LKSDIWSFGIFCFSFFPKFFVYFQTQNLKFVENLIIIIAIVCWEIINKSVPYPDKSNEEVAMLLTESGYHPSLPDKKTKPLLNQVLKTCFRTEKDGEFEF